jgi:HprK-related kinase A
MRLAELSNEAVVERLRDEALDVDFGAALVRIKSDVPDLARVLRIVYGEFPLLEHHPFADLTVELRRVAGVRRYVAPQIEFFVDGTVPFEPFPADTHLPLLEWGMNWCLAERMNHHLLLHCGVVERGGHAILLPALPGSGKSTLTAALALSGYRLLSDEFGVVRCSDQRVISMLRPTALKNESIELISGMFPNAIIGPRFPKTRKGTVAHLAPDATAVSERSAAAQPVILLFPKFVPGGSLVIEAMAKARAFAKLSSNAFNYDLLGPQAFEAVGGLIERCECWCMEYGQLDEALYEVDRLFAEVSARTTVPSTDGMVAH